MKILGIHHISAIVWHPQENIDFYASVLGLKLLKRTLNFDDSNVYHFYYGNDTGDIGTAITYFPWKKHYKEGQIGASQVGITTLMIPVGSFSFWQNRLTKFGIKYQVLSRFNETYMRFKDPHGVYLELIESDLGRPSKHEFNGVTSEVAIKGIYGAMLFSTDIQKTTDFIVNTLGISVFKTEKNFTRFELSQEFGKYLDLFHLNMGESKDGAGTYHHIAFTVKSEEIDLWKEKIEKTGFNVTEVKDRLFFKSIYFREPGGIIIELATNQPGFEVDTTYQLKPDLFIPPHYRPLSDAILKNIIPVEIKEIDTLTHYPYQNELEYKLWSDHQKLLKRINFLARESKVRDLTEVELSEQKELREIYIKSLRNTIQTSMESIKMENEDGEYELLKRKESKNNETA